MIKQATKKDIETLNSLNQEVQDLHHKLYPKKFKPHTKSDMKKVFEEFLDMDNAKILIKYNNTGKEIGYIMYRLKSYPENGYRYSYKALYIHHISVNKTHQGQGIGKELIDIAIKEGRAQKADYIELDVWSSNIGGKNFFMNQGFKEFNEKMSLKV